MLSLAACASTPEPAGVLSDSSGPAPLAGHDWFLNVEGARPGLDDPLAQEFVTAVGGTAQPKYGWTDVARFSALGIDCA